MSPRRRQAIYIITTDRGVVKVGISDNPIERLANLQTGSPFRLRLVYAAVHSDARRIETIVHHKLKDKLAYGEWFSVNQEVARQAILDAARSIGKPINEAGMVTPGRVRRFLFWLVLWAIVLWAAFTFFFSLPH